MDLLGLIAMLEKVYFDKGNLQLTKSFNIKVVEKEVDLCDGKQSRKIIQRFVEIE
jgi:hypothetical protein